ncbi:hypothetical protein GCM10009677_14010 [Sphaerisporangium rubeum]
MACASDVAELMRPRSTAVSIICMRKNPRTATTVIEITKVLVTTRSWRERRQTRRTFPAVRRARLRAPRTIWRGVRRVFFFGLGRAGPRAEVREDIGTSRRGRRAAYAGPAL